jgi:hypothetical protein
VTALLDPSANQRRSNKAASTGDENLHEGSLSCQASTI